MMEKTKCCVSVWDSNFSRLYPKPCARDSKVERDGKFYCTLHDPERVARKRAEKQVKFEEKWEAKSKKRTLERAALDLYEALEALLRRDENNTCTHEDTHRGGYIWTICDACGKKWADDEGGKPKWKAPPEWELAYAALAKAKGR